MSHTPLEAAERILGFMRKRKVEAGESASTTWFVEPFDQDGWTGNDFSAGLELAVEKGWIAVEGGGTSIRLTHEGARHAAG